MNDKWQGLYGQSYIKNSLEHFIQSGKVPHAILFHGLEGIGKDFAAVRFAQLLNQDSVGFEKISKSIETFSEPYIKFIFPLPRGKSETEDSGPFDKLSTEEIQIIRDEIQKKIVNPYHRISVPRASGIKISSIRDIRKFLSLDFSEISRRIILISDAHLMSEESQNALLKSLEEPPEGIIFILTTPYPDLMRETIRSRCWMMNFSPLAEKDIIQILIRYFEVEPKLAEKIAPFSGGSVKSALNLTESDFDELLNSTILLLRYSFGRKYHSALSVFDPYLKEGRQDSIRLLMNMVLIWLNDLQRYRTDKSNMFYNDHLETLEKFNTKFPDISLNNIVVKIERLLSLFRTNVNPSVIVLNLIFELSYLVLPQNTGMVKNR